MSHQLAAIQDYTLIEDDGFSIAEKLIELFCEQAQGNTAYDDLIIVHLGR